MRALAAILRELFGLFVDDGALALAVPIWIAVCGLALPRLSAPAGWDGVVLCLGLAVLLSANVLRSARRQRK